MCPTRGALLVNGDGSPLVFSRLHISLQRVVLAIPPRRPPRPENNHPRRVCQLFEKLTTISNCAYYSHLMLVRQLRFQGQPMIAYEPLPIGATRGTRRSGRFHSSGAALGFTL